MANDTCAAATIIGALPYSIIQNTTGNATDPITQPCGSGTSYNAAWYTFTAPTSAYRVEIDTTDSDYDVVLAAYSGTCGALVDVDCLDLDFIDRMFLHTVPGVQYYLLFSAYDPGGGSLHLDMRVAPGGWEGVLDSCVNAPTIDCETEFISITGSGLLTATVVITGPDGDPVAYSIESETDTTLIVSVDGGFVDGTYCVTVNDGTPACASLFCNTTTYPICRKRRFALPFTQDFWVFLYRLEFLIQSGESPNAEITIRLSRDGGDTWPLTRTLTAGTLGDAAFRVFTTSMGQGRNWVCEFITSEPYFWALIECYADIEVGTS